MKKNCLTLILLIQLALLSKADAQSLTIIEQDYEQAQQLANQQQKLLLIDFYTTWCGPCKLLDKMVFRDTAVSNTIAGNYVVLRYNAEKDSVYKLTQKHHIAMYPSAVVLNRQQRVVYQQYGTGGPEEALVANYIAFLNKARGMDSTGYYIPGIEASTQLPYPRFYSHYINRVQVREAEKQAGKYWDTLTNLQQEIPFKVFCYFGGGNNKWNDYFLQHRAEFLHLYGETDVLFATSMIVVGKVNSALSALNRPGFDSAIQLAKLYLNTPGNHRYTDMAELRMLQGEGKWDMAYSWLDTLKKQERANSEDITRFCRNAVSKCENEAVLNKLVPWMQTISESSPDYDNLELYARLLYKAGRKTGSSAIMKKAIEVGKKNNIDTSEGEKWLAENF